MACIGVAWAGRVLLKLHRMVDVVRTACGRDVSVPRVGGVRTAAARREARPIGVALIQ